MITVGFIGVLAKDTGGGIMTVVRARRSPVSQASAMRNAVFCSESIRVISSCRVSSVKDISIGRS